jgi:DNA topoisomerase-1
MAALKESGVTDLAALATTNSAILQKAGIGETEAHDLLAEARITHNGQILKEIGIPAVSLKKYLAAGVITPEEFCSTPLEELSARTGMSAGTVSRHVGLVCEYLHRPVPGKTPKTTRTRKGQKELLSARGMTTAVAEHLSKAGITDADSLLKADAQTLATRTGLDRDTILKIQTQIRKKREIIQI